MPARAWRALLAACLLAAGWTARAEAAEPLPVEQLAPGVYVHRGLIEDWEPGNGGDVANLGFVVGSRCVAVIDTGGSRAVGERLRLAVEAVTPLPVCYVVNTHAHPDHLLGNAAFNGPGRPPEFVAHARLPAALAARERYLRNAVQRDFGQALGPDAIVYPTRTVAEKDVLDLGDRQLELQAWPTAHTDHDLTVLDRRTGSLFFGDLLFARHIPVLDGKLRGWLRALAELERRRGVALAIPGHGEPGPPETLLARQRRYLEGLQRDVRAAIAAGRTLPQAVAAITPTGGWALSDRFHRRNVTAAYAELEWDE